MAARLVDRIAQSLSSASARREAVKGLVATGLSVVASPFAGDSGAAHKKNRKCRHRREPCAGKKKCCHHDKGVICDVVTTPMACANASQRVCCGKDGAPCNPDLLGCDCCGELFCVQYQHKNLCRSEET